MQCERQDRGRHARAARGDHGSREVDARALERAAQLVGGVQCFVRTVQCVVGQVAAAGDVAAAQSRPRLRLPTEEAPTRARVEHLLPAAGEVRADGREVADQLRAEARSEPSRRRRDHAGFNGTALGAPLRQPPVQHGHRLVAEDAERPPDACCAHRGTRVVDHHPVPVADAECAHGPAELFGARQHVGQRRPLVGDLVDVEEERTGDVGFGPLLAGIALEAGQVPGAVHDAKVGLAEMGREPVRGDERADHGPILLRAGHARRFPLVSAGRAGAKP